MPDISPVARAIVAAFDARYELCGPFDDNWQELCLAAALRVLAEHRTTPDSTSRSELHRIAAELEGHR